jgi:AcrR family transcriptional regulator
MPPARPAATAGARERILDVASELFYRDGFRAVGIDTIVARAGVAKTTLYHHFASKDELIVAYLERSNQRFWDWFEAAVADADDPRAELVTLFDAVARLARSPACLGCAFQGAAAEFPAQDNPGHRAARAHKQAVLERLAELAADAGARDPAQLARELLLVMDGAFAATRMFGRASPAAAAPAAAAALLDAQLPRQTQG